MTVKKSATAEKKRKRKLTMKDLIELYNEGAFTNEPIGKVIASAMEAHLRLLITSYQQDLIKLAEEQEANGEIIYTPIYYGKGAAGVRKAIAERKEIEKEISNNKKIGFLRED